MPSFHPALEPLVLTWVGLFGLVLGSYLNVVIHRLPRRLSTVTPRSRCPGCGTLIRARDNIPVLSYLLLRGRCRHCAAPISWRYPVIELLTGALFVTSYLRFGPGPRAVAAAGLCAALLALALIDWEHYLLPDAITLPGIAVGLLAQPWLGWVEWGEALLGVLGVGGGLWLAAAGWRRLRGADGLGMGDVKLVAMLAAFLGWQGALLSLLLASLGGCGFGLAMLLRRRMTLDSRLPFGVFLALAAVLALFVLSPQLTPGEPRLWPR